MQCLPFSSLSNSPNQHHLVEIRSLLSLIRLKEATSTYNFWHSFASAHLVGIEIRQLLPYKISQGLT